MWGNPLRTIIYYSRVFQELQQRIADISQFLNRIPEKSKNDISTDLVFLTIRLIKDSLKIGSIFAYLIVDVISNEVISESELVSGETGSRIVGSTQNEQMGFN